MSQQMEWFGRQLRLIPALVGVASLGVANRLWELDQLYDTPNSFLPDLWPWWMLVAAILGFIFAGFPTNRWLMATSGAVTAVGFLGQAAIVLLGMADGSTDLKSPQASIIGIIYTLSAFLVAVVWIKLMRPATWVLRNASEVARKG